MVLHTQIYLHIYMIAPPVSHHKIKITVMNINSAKEPLQTFGAALRVGCTYLNHWWTTTAALTTLHRWSLVFSLFSWGFISEQAYSERKKINNSNPRSKCRPWNLKFSSTEFSGHKNNARWQRTQRKITFCWDQISWGDHPF